jgi:hypothetical protein
MLSFMREQEPPKASDHPAAGPGLPNAPTSDAPEAQEYLTVTANSKSLRRSTMLVAVLVGIGLVCLLLMIRKSQPQAASATEGKSDQTKIEAAISRLTGVRSEMADRMDEIVKKFYEFSDVVQVKVSELAKNPFEVAGAMKELKAVAAVEDPQAQAELIRRQRLEQQAKTLKLLSIMRSDQGDCCMINDQILRQGDSIEGFKIVRVGSNSVELAWPANGASGAGAPQMEEMKIVLKLSE